MNPNLDRLHPYPFEKLNQLKQGCQPPSDKPHIALSIGEPKHATPAFIHQTFTENLSGIAKYPTTKGIPELRLAISQWLSKRFAIPDRQINHETQVLPVSGTREALFSFAQACFDPDKTEKDLILMPNPFYQIYEGAAILAGATPYYMNTPKQQNYLIDIDAVPASIWQRCQLIYICSPGNPTGQVLGLKDHVKLFHLAEKYDFIIASDECYTEIYADEDKPPQGLLQSAYLSGNTAFKRCMIFQSLSKRSNAPGLRSGFVAGDSELIERYFLYRTYQGCALPVSTQHASISAWNDESHVISNRDKYREKYQAFIEILEPHCSITQPPASFYLWLETPIDDIEFAKQLFRKENITVLPGSFLSRETDDGINPGKNHVRIALVAEISECKQAAERIKNFFNTLN